MPKIKEIFKTGVKEAYTISFSTRLDKFTISYPVTAKKVIGGYLGKGCFDTYQECIDKIDSIHEEVLQEEVLIRKVIYVTMQTNYDAMKDKYSSNSQTGSQGFKWCWFVLNEYQVGAKLMYKVIDHSQYANNTDKTRMNILPQLMFAYQTGEITLLDYSEGLLDKIKAVEISLEASIQKVKSFFKAEKLETNLLSLSGIKLLG